jgi:hypothetical protein
MLANFLRGGLLLELGWDEAFWLLSAASAAKLGAAGCEAGLHSIAHMSIGKKVSICGKNT